MYTDIIELLLKVISCGSSVIVRSKVETVGVINSEARSMAKKLVGK